MSRLKRLVLACLPALVLPLLAAGEAPAQAAGAVHTVTFADDAGPLSPWPAYSPTVARYALPQGTGTTGTVTLTATTDDPAGTIQVNGQTVDSGTEITLTTLTPGDEISVIFTDPGSVTAQSWFYLPAGFPQLHSTGSASSTPVFLTLASFTGAPFETIVDRNGVPLYAVQTRSSDFKQAAHDPTHYSVARTSPTSPAPPAPAEYEIVELDATFQPVRSVQLDVTPEVTDFHDAEFLPGGGALLMGYGVSTHTDGKDYIDAVIQVVDSAGHATFTWNSKDHIDVSEAYVDLDATFGDYAHINSLQMLANGDVLASFRNTSQVMRIATTAHDGFQPGDVVWRFGGKHSDFSLVDDPDDGFCAQHAAQFLPNGHLMLFDNGSRKDTAGAIAAQTAAMCPDPADPVNGALERAQTRIVEYSLDETGHVATYVGERSVPGRYAAFAGNAQRLANGNTFIGWSMSEPADAPIASEIDASNTEQWALFAPTTGPRYFSYRAFSYPAPDAIAPVVSSPIDGVAFREGQTPNAAFLCTDKGGSTLASCVGSTPSGQPLDMTPGAHSLTVTATDGAGNTTTRTYRYTVAPRFQPDAWVRKPGAAWKGQNVYGGIAKQQVSLKVGKAGGSATAQVRLQNDGFASDRLTVSGTKGSATFTVRYLLGTTDITKAVTAGTFRTASLTAGGTVTVKIVLTRTSKAVDGEKLRARLDITSVGLPARTDAVAATIKAS